MATKAPPELSAFQRFVHDRDSTAFTVKTEADAAQLAADTAAADLAARRAEFVDTVTSAPPVLDLPALTEALTARVAAATEPFFVAVADYNRLVTLTRDSAKALGLTGADDGAVFVRAGLGVGTGLHINGRQVQRREHQISAAERAAVSGVRRADAEAGR